MAEGSVASSPFLSLQAHHAKHQADFVRFDPLSTYLVLNSLSLQPLRGTLFNNSLIAQQFDSRYGLLKQLRCVLLDAPLHVRLYALETGRFEVEIQAKLMLAACQIDTTERSLDAAATALLKRWFQRVERPLLFPDGGPQTVSLLFGWIPRGIPKVDDHWVLHLKARWRC